MPDFQYTGDTEQVFIFLSTDGHTVQVKPGDVVTLDVDPGIETLVAVTTPAKASKGDSAPVAPDPVPDVAGGDVAPATDPAQEA